MRFSSLTLALLLAATPAVAQQSIPTIPVQRDTLANGLTLVMSSDHHAPVVSVTVWYHVGSKNELPGHTGFAHLFEHMMFQGSAHVPKGVHIKTIEDVGGEFNGTTENDRTNYFETVPINELETVLWLESDRMGFLLPALTQAKLDNQRDVVKNERRQRVDNVPFGSSNEVMMGALFPAGNPYSWPVIGSMADLSAASVDDVKNFFRHYYVPNNAVIAIVGDIDTVQTRKLVEKYFGGIPRGPEVTRPTVPLAALAGEKRLVLEDEKGTQPALEIAWPTVPDRSPDADALSTLGAVLTMDRTSRLTKVLVYDRQLATGVEADQDAMEDEGYFLIHVVPRPGVSMTTLEQVTDSVIGALANDPPTAAEVDRTKHYALVGTVLGLEGVHARAETIAEGQTYYGDPDHFAKDLRDQMNVSANDVGRVAKQYLTGNRVVLSMVPAGKLDMVSKPDVPYTNVTSKTGTDANTATTGASPAPSPVAEAHIDSEPPRPIPGPPPAVRIPKIQMRTLSNGVKLAVLENHTLPIVSVDMLMEVSSELDPQGKEGLGGFTGSMLKEGTTTMNADQLSQAEADLGSEVSATGFETITANTDSSLSLMADQLLNPSFPQASLDRIKANSLAQLKRQKDQPGYHAGRIFVRVLYGADHPYTRQTTEASVGAITRDDLVNFYHDYYRPRNATIIVAGDITPDEAVKKLDHAFAQWAKGGKDGNVVAPPPKAPSPTEIYLYDRPGSPQSVVLIGQIGPRRDTKDHYALELANTVLDGAFNSRINLDLREQHGYTYGAEGGFRWHRVPEPSTFIMQSGIATPKTDSALMDIAADIHAFQTTRPVTDSELTFAKQTATLDMPLQFATNSGVEEAVAGLFEAHLPLDYYDHLSANYNAVTLAQVKAAADKYFDPAHMAIVIEGDRNAIEAGLTATKIAPVVVVGDDAKPATTTTSDH